MPFSGFRRLCLVKPGDRPAQAVLELHLRLEAHQLPGPGHVQLPPGLPVGAQAPRFALAELGGETRTLESLCAQGKPVMLAFVSPGCGPCQNVFREIGRWQGVLSDRLTVAVVSSGTAAENLPIAREHGITGVLLQEDFEVFRAYRVRLTPSALVVAPRGTIASAPVEGAPAIEPLVRLTLRRWPAAPAPGPAVAQ